MGPWYVFLGLVSWACLMCSSAWVVSNGSLVTGQAPTWLKITTDQPDGKLGHQIGYHL